MDPYYGSEFFMDDYQLSPFIPFSELDLDVAQNQLFDINLPENIDAIAALLGNNSADENILSTEENPTTSFVVESPLMPVGGLAYPLNLIDEDSLFRDFDNDTSQANAFVNNQAEVALNAFDDLGEAQHQLFDINLSEYIDVMAAFPVNNAVDKNIPSTEENLTASFVVKSSETKNTTNFINTNEVIRTGKSLQLTVPPFSYQRARYERELDETLRYVFVAYDGSLTLTIPNIRDSIAPGVSICLRVTRITTPYGSDNLILCHPYSTWIKDNDSKAFNGSLFIPAPGETMKIENLVLTRSKQGALGKIKQLPIFTSKQINFNNFHPINKQTSKKMITEYNLDYSVLHFQIFLVDQNNKAYPTDLECQTEPIYEFEGKELKSLPSSVRDIMKRSVKRKTIGQRKESFIKTNKKKITRNYKSC